MTAVLTAAHRGPADRAPSDRRPVASGWRWVAVAGTGLAGVGHVAAAVTHLTAAPTAAALFVLVALVQLTAAGWLALGARGSGWDTRLVGAVLVGTVVVLLAHLVAHTTTWLDVLHGAAAHSAHATGHAAETAGPVSLGLDAPSQVEPGGPLGTAVAAAELLAVLGLVALLPARTRSTATSLLLAAGVVVWLSWATGLLG